MSFWNISCVAEHSIVLCLSYSISVILALLAAFYLYTLHSLTWSKAHRRKNSFTLSHYYHTSIHMLQICVQAYINVPLFTLRFKLINFPCFTPMYMNRQKEKFHEQLPFFPVSQVVSQPQSVLFLNLRPSNNPWSSALYIGIMPCALIWYWNDYDRDDGEETQPEYLDVVQVIHLPSSFISLANHLSSTQNILHICHSLVKGYGHLNWIWCIIFSGVRCWALCMRLIFVCHMSFTICSYLNPISLKFQIQKKQFLKNHCFVSAAALCIHWLHNVYFIFLNWKCNIRKQKQEIHPTNV